MTVISTFKIDDVPVLISDLMISKKTDSRKNKSAFPAMNPDHQKHVENLNLEFSHRRKIAAINDHFVLGWSGSFNLAHKIISALRQEYGQKNVTKDCLKKFLKSFDSNEEKEHVGLTGWLILGGQPISFGWYSYNASLLDFGQHSYQMGSMPEEKLSKCICQDRPVGSTTELNPRTGEITCAEIDDQESFVRGHLCGIVSSLYETIIGDKTSYEDRYGFGFEAVYYIGGKFRVLDNLEFHFWDCRENKEATDIAIYGVENLLRTAYIEGEPHLLQCVNFPVEGQYANDGVDDIKIFKALDIEENVPSGWMEVEQLEAVMNRRYNAIYLWQIQTACGKRGIMKTALLAESSRVFTYGMAKRQVVSYIDKPLFDAHFQSKIKEATEFIKQGRQ